MVLEEEVGSGVLTNTTNNCQLEQESLCQVKLELLVPYSLEGKIS